MVSVLGTALALLFTGMNIGGGVMVWNRERSECAAAAAVEAKKHQQEEEQQPKKAQNSTLTQLNSRAVDGGKVQSASRGSGAGRAHRSSSQSRSCSPAGRPKRA